MLNTKDYNSFTHQEWMSIEETSQLFQLSVRSIMKLLEKGELYSVKWGKERKIRVTSVFCYLTRKGIVFPAELSQEFRDIINYERNMYESEETLGFVMEKIIENKAIELYTSGYFDTDEYKKSLLPPV